MAKRIVCALQGWNPAMWAGLSGLTSIVAVSSSGWVYAVSMIMLNALMFASIVVTVADRK